MPSDRELLDIRMVALHPDIKQLSETLSSSSRVPTRSVSAPSRASVSDLLPTSLASFTMLLLLRQAPHYTTVLLSPPVLEFQISSASCDVGPYFVDESNYLRVDESLY